MTERTCCFFGHREINDTEDLRLKITETVELLINEKGVDAFLFGSKSTFDKLCLELVTEIKKKYPHIKRVYVRAEYPYIDEGYERFLLQSYDETYFPQKILGAGKSVYIERNYEMVNRSKYCIVYYDEDYIPRTKKQKDNAFLSPKPRKSGTSLALDYAVRKEKEIFIINTEKNKYTVT